MADPAMKRRNRAKLDGVNPLLRLGPYLYAAIHSYNSVWELLLSRSERLTAERDAERLRTIFPFLADYRRRADVVRQRLLPSYREYTVTVSPDPIAISLELAVFLGVMCEAWRPNAILDLGSGFSSYVFRAYAKDRSNVSPLPVIHSVDEAAPWLEKTRTFLQRHNLDGGQLSTLDSFGATQTPKFDLVLQDIATLGRRLRMLDFVVGACRPGGAIIIDDMHVPGYRHAVIRELHCRGLTYLSLRTFTRKRLRYAYLVLR